ncbi:Fe-S-cluster-containing hydrogenase [Comamonas sp. JC664]|uniref:Fe-S-cluster-containing hydrogenase n=1 Tax=Comamonas sp. JC664 TaxID=2801917 RepID=UPI00191E90DC|nr:Fe-S-cluster-containing hydrogenase [Comamonas sp. JC664]MBL0694408.1 Fe-S-cluster-containing hydrogenase [Comamonas sp. JC664]GHG77462.1 molybdopterin oxidoreductase [Comamonas sp. KCTC 72670]
MPPLTDRYPLPVLGGPEPWRSLEARAQEEEGTSPEFPPGAEAAPRGVSRRALLELAAFGTAVSGLAGCFRAPNEKVLPYSRPPPEFTPGVPHHYATGFVLDGYVRGVLARSQEGRPTLVSGNPSHPESLGAAGAHEQASLLGLYDPHRARAVRHRDVPTSLARLFEMLRRRAARTDGGAGLRLLVEPSASPLWARTCAQLLERFPEARVVPFSSTDTGQAEAGARLALGRPLRAIPDWRAARAVVSLDDDFLSTAVGGLRASREFIAARMPPELNRLWVVESRLSLTGAFADERLRARPSRVPLIARGLAAEVGRVLGREDLATLAGSGPDLSTAERRWVEGAARNLAGHGARSWVAVGEAQPPAVHALAHLLNAALGDGTVRCVERVLVPPPDAGALSSLVEDLQAGRVDTLLITAWNPVFRAPTDVPLGAALERVEDAVYCALHEDETSARVSWSVPTTHPYESWEDGRAMDGTATVLQPLIAPLLDSAVSPLELVAAFTGALATPPYARLRAQWRAHVPPPESFEDAWERWLAEGIIPGTRLPELRVPVDASAVLAAVRRLPSPDEGLELHFVTDTKVHDGRFGANPWLQELPDPVTQLTWDNAVWVSPATASRLALSRGARVRLELRGRAVEAPVLVVPGQADDTLTVPLGYGQRLGSPVSRGVGFDAQALRFQDAPWFAPGVRLSRVEGHHDFALTQEHWRMEGRPVALQTTAARFAARDDSGLERLQAPQAHLYPPTPTHAEVRHRWGMAIDLHRCTGCSACVVACQAENNIPAVGKDQVRRGREMHWLRIDRYFQGDEHEPSVITQPLMCVHCEYAPCEYVCPVAATVHSDEGLNQMVYNRCVGTRYCSNNCPYKVRRFNYLEYNRGGPLDRMYRNPQVTVRSRGVMEKCTYCVQRIEGARITARVEGRDIRQGEVRTACQQACPTGAIVFGDLERPEDPVSQLHRDPRHYALLNHLGTQPRTVHLIRLKNPWEDAG